MRKLRNGNTNLQPEVSQEEGKGQEWLPGPHLLLRLRHPPCPRTCGSDPDHLPPGVQHGAVEQQRGGVALKEG